MCLEFSAPNTFYSATTDRVYWQGQVSDAKFDAPKLFSKDEELRYDVRNTVDDYWFLCSLPATDGAVSNTGKPYFLPDSSSSDVTTTKSEITKSSNKAVIEFERPLETKSDLTVDLVEDAIYISYISWGVFDSKSATVDAKGQVNGKILVRGDTLAKTDPADGSSKQIQRMLEFPIADAPPVKCSQAKKLLSKFLIPLTAAFLFSWI